MFTSILLAVDGSDASLRAARLGIALASSLKSRMTALVVTVSWAAYFSREFAVVVPDVVVSQSEYDHKRNARSESILQSVESEARNTGVSMTSVYRVSQYPHSAIVVEANKQR